MPSIATLKDKRNSKIAEATKLIADTGLRSVEARASHKKLTDELDLIDKDIATLSGLEARLTPKTVAPAVAAPAIIESESEKRKRISLAFREYLRHGTTESRDITIAGNSGALVPQDFSEDYTIALKQFSPLLGMIKTVTDSEYPGAPVKNVISDPTALTMSLVTEGGATVGLEADPTVSSTIPGTDTQVGLTKYSVNLLNSAFRLEEFLKETSAVTVARALEYSCLTGLSGGTGTALPNSPAGGLLGNVTTGATVATLGTIAYDDIVNLQSSVDFAYGQNGVYLGSQSVHDYLLKQVDSTGRPLYPVGSDGNLILAGRPLVVASSAMAAYNTASKPVLLFGSFRHAISAIVPPPSLLVLRERFMDVLERALLTYVRFGSAMLLPQAVKALVNPA